MLDELDDYDWEHAFDLATGQPSPALPGQQVDTRSFVRAEVEKILWSVEGENDGPSWLMVVLLYDGRFATVEAGCDYTGWG